MGDGGRSFHGEFFPRIIFLSPFLKSSALSPPFCLSPPVLLFYLEVQVREGEAVEKHLIP